LQLLKAGVHPKVVSERLGHASIGITLDTYSHVMPGMQEEAAEKIDAGLRTRFRMKVARSWRRTTEAIGVASKGRPDGIAAVDRVR
jgi:hypothetical protein